MFPKSTELPNKFIAKEKFYKYGEFSAFLKTAMTNDVAKIMATNQFSARSLNVKEGSIFPEIMVLRVVLKRRVCNTQLLDLMDKSIRAAYVLFVLEFDGKYCLSIAYKDKNKDNISIVKRWTSNWQKEISLDIEGGSIDAIYESLIKQISGGKIEENAEKGLKEKVSRSIEQEKIAKKIEQLENKMNNEPQLKKKLEIKSMIKALKEGV